MQPTNNRLTGAGFAEVLEVFSSRGEPIEMQLRRLSVSDGLSRPATRRPLMREAVLDATGIQRRSEERRRQEDQPSRERAVRLIRPLEGGDERKQSDECSFNSDSRIAALANRLEIRIEAVEIPSSERSPSQEHADRGPSYVRRPTPMVPSGRLSQIPGNRTSAQNSRASLSVPGLRPETIGEHEIPGSRV